MDYNFCQISIRKPFFPSLLREKALKIIVCTSFNENKISRRYLMEEVSRKKLSVIGKRRDKCGKKMFSSNTLVISSKVVIYEPELFFILAIA